MTSNGVPKPRPPMSHDSGFAERCRACRLGYGPPVPGRPYPLDVAVHHQRMVLAQWRRRLLQAVRGG